MTIHTKRIAAQVLTVAAGVGLLASLSVPLPATAAQSMPYDFDPGLAAKFAKEKVKQRGPRRRSKDYGSRNSGGGGGSDNCGSVDIGNSNSSGQRQTAAQRFRERNRTVIVTGPVINAARCR